MTNPTISKIRIYPIKSLGHIELKDAEISTFSLMNDREFAMLDEDGGFVNGKRNWKVNLLKTEYDINQSLVIFSQKKGAEKKQFELRSGNAELDHYLSEFFGTKLKLIENKKGQLMDIPKASSVTIISDASLQSLQQDLATHSLESIRLRFRSNIELSGVDPYWEEALYHEPGYGTRFELGDVTMIGISPRARCNVPPQDPVTGENDDDFVKNMIASRKKHELSAAKVLMYGKTPYFLAVNVFIPESETGKTIKLGEELKILGPVELSV